MFLEKVSWIFKRKLSPGFCLAHYNTLQSSTTGKGSATVRRLTRIRRDWQT